MRYTPITVTVEPLIYEPPPPHEQPLAIYDHISCNGW